MWENFKIFWIEADQDRHMHNNTVGTTKFVLWDMMNNVEETQIKVTMDDIFNKAKEGISTVIESKFKFKECHKQGTCERSRNKNILPGLRHNTIVTVGQISATRYISIFYPVE
jgi:hypothetical protein